MQVIYFGSEMHTFFLSLIPDSEVQKVAVIRRCQPVCRSPASDVNESKKDELARVESNKYRSSLLTPGIMKQHIAVSSTYGQRSCLIIGIFADNCCMH